jgi:hypothetical protein
MQRKRTAKTGLKYTQKSVKNTTYRLEAASGKLPCHYFLRIFYLWFYTHPE